MDRRAVRDSFHRAAASYDAAARLQRQVCALLLEELPVLPAPAAILDAGCGTGHGLGLLAARWPSAHLLGVDFAPAMAAAARGVCADVEALPLPDACVGLYWSSLSFQWCDPDRAFREAARVLAPGGRLAVSSLAAGTLGELAEAFAGTDRHPHVLDFSAAPRLADAARQAGLEEVRFVQRPVVQHYPDLPALLRELKALGAQQVGGPRRPGLLGRRAWQGIVERYEAKRGPAGLPATFEVILCTAQKPIS